MAKDDTISDPDAPSPDSSEQEFVNDSFSFTSPPMLIGIVGGLIGLIGLIVGTMGFLKASSMSSSMDELETKIREEASSRLFADKEIDKELSGYDARLENIGSEIIKVKRSQMDPKQIQRVVDSINTLGRDVKINRDEINDNRLEILNVQGLVEDLADNQAKPMTVVQKSIPTSSDSTGYSSSSSVSNDSGNAAVAEDGYHVIESGDTFDRLAKLYGVTIEALMSANLGINPRRLQIGQKVAIPTAD